MKKLLVVIIFLLVAVVFIVNVSETSVAPVTEREHATKIDFQDFHSTDLAPPWGTVHP